MTDQQTKDAGENGEVSKTRTKAFRFLSTTNITIALTLILLIFAGLTYLSNRSAENRDIDIQAVAIRNEVFNLLGVVVRATGIDDEKMAELKIVRGVEVDVSEDDLRTALELIEKYTLLKPDDADTADFMRVMHALKSRDIDRAVSLFEAQGAGSAYYGDITTDEDVPPKVQAYLFGAMIAASISSLELAREFMELALAEEPNSPSVLLSYALFLHSIEENSASIDLAKTAIVVDPNNPAHYTFLGHVYSESNQMELAELALRLAVTMEPKSAQTFNGLAVVLAYQDKHQEAVEYYRMAIDLDPHDGTQYRNLEISLRQLGRNAEADLAEEKARLYTESD
jgi:tetratricopeptide (TPR) repeat protein